MNWARKQRIEFISKFLKKHGRINRTDITSKFGTSIPQASIDLKEYLKLNPRSLKYNHAKHFYEYMGDK